MGNKPKVAVIGLKGLPAFGGAATVGESIIKQLKDQYEFTVYSITSHTNLTSGNYKNICYQKVLKSIPLKKLNSFLYYICSAILVLFSDYDLVHLHHRDGSFILPLLKIRYKVILTTHGMVLTDKWEKYKLFFDVIDKFFLKYADVITTVSKKDQKIVSDLLAKSAKPIIHIPNGINPIHINVKRHDKISFAAGRIVPNKGCHILLEALIYTRINIETLIIGDLGQMRDYRKQLMIYLTQLANVNYVGLLKDKYELFEMIASCKLFVYPSLIESMSMMMLEVASLKVPIICSRIKENEDIFSDDEVLYFEPGSSVDLANKIMWALKNLSVMEVKAELAYNKLVSRYLWDNISGEYAKAYDSLLFENNCRLN